MQSETPFHTQARHGTLDTGPVHATGGTSNVVLTDEVGNLFVWFTADVAGLGFDTSFTVI